MGKNSGNRRFGFTLVEVLIGISLLTVVMASMVALLVVSMRANQANINRLVAYNLAQEGLEGIRNVRDSHWLQNFDWKGVFDSDYTDNPANLYFGEDDFYRIYLNLEMSDPNPWLVDKLGVVGEAAAEDDGRTQIYQKREVGGELVYNHVKVGEVWGEESQFGRYLEVNFLTDKEVRVTCTVFWKETWQDESVQNKRLQLTTELTDWRGGPL